MKYCFGVDIGGTTVKLGLFTTEGEIVDKWEIKTRTENQGEAVLPDIAAALNEKLEEKQIPKDEVEGIRSRSSCTGRFGRSCSEYSEPWLGI